MSKIEKKKEKLKERIKILEDDMLNSLTKKSSNIREINVPEQTRKIQEAKKQLAELE